MSGSGRPCGCDPGENYISEECARAGVCRCGGPFVNVIHVRFDRSERAWRYPDDFIGQARGGFEAIPELDN